MIDPLRIERLQDELEHVASQIDESLLSFASPEARDEWTFVCGQWRSRTARPVFRDDDLTAVIDKVRRFGDILRSAKQRTPTST